MLQTEADDDILQADNMDTVRANLISIANTDPENTMAVWISDLDASVLTQSDGFTSGEGWDVTTREWYKCIDLGKTILTEPYVDSSTGKMILSAVSPVYDDATGSAIGAVGIDISMEHMTEVMSEYKIGRNGYILLLSENGTFIYHPQSDIVEKNIAEIDISQNVVNAVLSGSDVFLRYTVDGVAKYGSVSPCRQHRIHRAQQPAIDRILFDADPHGYRTDRDLCTWNHTHSGQHPQERRKPDQTDLRAEPHGTAACRGRSGCAPQDRFGRRDR